MKRNGRAVVSAKAPSEAVVSMPLVRTARIGNGDGEQTNEECEEVMLMQAVVEEMITRPGEVPQEMMAMVARTISRSEARTNPKCQQALDKEWKSWRMQKCGVKEDVRNWHEVRSEAARENREIHVGSLYELMVEKGSELQPDDPNRKMKGRVVFLGGRVKDAEGNYAIFEELSSSPAAMCAGKFADADGSLPGHVIETADGEQAYPQAKMSSTVKTWIRLPPHRRDPSWSNMRDPVVQMKQALYGHPDAGGYWENIAKTG